MEKSQINTPQNEPDVKARAREMYLKGADAWQRGDRAAAITLYAESAELDPDGPGAQALEMSNRIMAFYDKNQYNP